MFRNAQSFLSFYSVYITFISTLSASFSLQMWPIDIIPKFLYKSVDCWNENKKIIQLCPSFTDHFFQLLFFLLLLFLLFYLHVKWETSKASSSLPGFCRRNQKSRNINMPHIMGGGRKTILKCGAICVSNIETHNP
jgi:hypothetical protein